MRKREKDSHPVDQRRVKTTTVTVYIEGFNFDQETPEAGTVESRRASTNLESLRERIADLPSTVLGPQSARALEEVTFGAERTPYATTRVRA